MLQNPNADDAIMLRRSLNEHQGLEFTYLSWIFVDDFTNGANKGQSILIIGAGGAAKAIAHACADHKPMALTIVNRTLSKAKELAINEKDTGSSEVQIGLLTEKIESLSKHIGKFKKDKHSSVGLLKAVNRRKKLLNYLKKNKIDSYKNVINKLNLRK